jgi:hypothetical protein
MGSQRSLIFGTPSLKQTFTLDLADVRQPRPWANPLSGEHSVTVSPDGAWAAYVSDQSGRPEVYVRPSSGNGGAVQVSMSSGDAPTWSHSGGELFFRDGQRSVLMAVSVTTKPTLTVSGPRRIMPPGSAAANVAVDSYDVMPDDRHFVVARETSADSTNHRQLSIITSWLQELNARVH